ncbi:hypothetical protein NE236_03475 [Actinoallomurus purpureus]|uniref:hypothetical protein n=1 Tax=Actinoallomurus purpureus TaxID=478114 RepID=UPI002092953E|nr:hypothetical protein [Actinoallomurus purpureus]MCO6004030.1 hypothetical protein [Actinoallomurus purpureus]
MIIELDPLRAAGPVSLGMSFEEAGRALAAWGTPRPFAPYPGAEPLDWQLWDSGVSAHVFCGSAGVVQTVEISRAFEDPDVEPQARVLLLGMDVFSVPARQVIAELGARYDVDDDVGHGVVVRELSVGMSRDLGEPFPSADRWCFDGVLIAGPGYYDPPPRDGGS